VPNRPGAARGSVVSPCRLLQDELVQGKVGYGLPEPGILKLQLLQPLHLVQLQPAVFMAPPVLSHLGHPDLPDRVAHRRPLLNKDIHLPQLGDNLFRRVLLPWHVMVLLDAIRHTSSRTTSVGVDQ